MTTKAKSRQRNEASAARETLHLTLHREFFDAIVKGSKRTEYRADTPYWRTRLQVHRYSEIIFRNGYLRNAPEVRVQCLGIRRLEGEFAIRLGKILHIKNYQLPATAHRKRLHPVRRF